MSKVVHFASTRCPLTGKVAKTDQCHGCSSCDTLETIVAANRTSIFNDSIFTQVYQDESLTEELVEIEEAYYVQQFEKDYEEPQNDFELDDPYDTWDFLFEANYGPWGIASKN